MEILSDEELMTNVANGELDDLTILFDRHHLHVFNFLFKMSNDRMLSEDITQEVFYKIMKYRNSYNGGRFISWMFSIARNSLKTHFKKNKENHSDIFGIEYQFGERDPHENDDVSHLHLALNKLCKSDRELITLNKLQDMKYADIAEIVGSTPGAVRTKVSRAIGKLRQFYFQKI